MEFDKSKVYTALNAEELHEGDKVICANNLAALIDTVEGSDGNDNVKVIESILEIMNTYRFSTMDNNAYNLAYLIDRKKEHEYIPWTNETCPLKCGDIITSQRGTQQMITGICKKEKSVGFHGSWNFYKVLLYDGWTFNGKPCGTEVN